MVSESYLQFEYMVPYENCLDNKNKNDLDAEKRFDILYKALYQMINQMLTIAFVAKGAVFTWRVDEFFENNSKFKIMITKSYGLFKDIDSNLY